MTLKSSTNGKALSLHIIGRVTNPLSVPIETQQAMDCLELVELAYDLWQRGTKGTNWSMPGSSLGGGDQPGRGPGKGAQ